MLKKITGRKLARMRAAARALLCAACLFAPAASAQTDADDVLMLQRGDWPKYANGPNILALPAVRETLRRFDERNPGAGIVILYPGGHSGRKWARELRDWLVAFGVPLQYLDLQPGAGAAGRLVLEVEGK